MGEHPRPRVATTARILPNDLAPFVGADRQAIPLFRLPPPPPISAHFLIVMWDF